MGPAPTLPSMTRLLPRGTGPTKTKFWGRRSTPLPFVRPCAPVSPRGAGVLCPTSSSPGPVPRWTTGAASGTSETCPRRTTTRYAAPRRGAAGSRQGTTRTTITRPATATGCRRRVGTSVQGGDGPSPVCRRSPLQWCPVDTGSVRCLYGVLTLDGGRTFLGVEPKVKI